MTRILLFIFCSILYAAGCADKVSDTIAQGTAGALGWELKRDGILTISGTGDIPDYQVTPTENLPSWFEYRNKITGVIIDNDVSRIGDYTFFRCENLVSVTFGNSVTTIGHDAFAACTSLTSILIPNTVTGIGYGAFYGCTGLTSVTIGNSVTSIGNYTFTECIGLTSVTIPSSVTAIGNAAFAYCSGLTEIINERTVPQTITSDVFSHVDIYTGTLRVPDESIEAYRAAKGWRSFGNIVAITGAP